MNDRCGEHYPLDKKEKKYSLIPINENSVRKTDFKMLFCTHIIKCWCVQFSTCHGTQLDACGFENSPVNGLIKNSTTEMVDASNRVRNSVHKQVLHFYAWV